MSMSHLASDYLEQGKYAQAESLYSQVLKIRSRVLGPEHPDTLGAMDDLATDYMEEGKYEQTEALYSQALEIKQRVLGPENPATALTSYNMGCLEALRGDKDKAIVWLRDAIDHGLSPQIDLAMEKDSDLTSLYHDPRFTALVAHAKQMAAAKSAPAHASD
jgi:eukaryotic-like serine/threonine-protein kinase